VAAEGAKAQPQARSAPSVELPLVTASREELSAMPVKDLKKILAERGIGCARGAGPCVRGSSPSSLLHIHGFGVKAIYGRPTHQLHSKRHLCTSLHKKTLDEDMVS